MKRNVMAMAVVGLLGGQIAAAAVDVVWNKMPGLGVHIAGNANGQNWAIGIDRVSTSGYAVFRWINGNWNRQPGVGRRITVDPSGVAWMVDDQTKIYRFNSGSNTWQDLPGLGTDIAAGGDGSIWLLGTAKVAGGYSIYKWDGNTQNWSSIPGAGLRIAVEKSGSPWVVNDSGDIFRYDLTARNWSLKAGKAHSVHTGLSSGTVWILGTAVTVGGYPVSRYVPATQGWEQYGTFGAVGMTEVSGTPWIVQSDGSFFSKGADVTLSITVTDTPVPAVPAPQPPIIRTSDGSGKLLCSQVGLTNCGTTNADYVGAYTLDLSCDSGFYDPIWGGTCWKCPDDTDSRGTWIRSSTAVTNDDACWRVPSEKTGSATKVKSPAWAWDCPSGSFWDGYSPDGLGGSCWQCPGDLPRRTAAAVWASNACASSLNETKAASLLSFNGCPKPNASTMNLAGKRSPGRPFLDIAAGWNQGASGGGCFACPMVDDAGNFLITERNGNPLYNKDNNSGCNIMLKWQPPAFSDTGLAYLQGVKDLIWEQRLFDGDRITGFLYDMAAARDLGDATPEAKAWVTARWKEMAVKPYNSEQFRTFLFSLLKTAIKRDPSQRTPAEQKLIASFASYVRDRRTYLSTQALAMYDAWKAQDDQHRQDTGQTKSLGQYFYYGTVPMDFHGMLSGLMGAGGIGGGVLGSMVAANTFAGNVGAGFLEGTSARGDSLFAMLEELKTLKSVQGAAIISGASVIEVAFAILTSVAIDQFTAIQEARPKLLASLAQSKLPVDLGELSKSTDGEDMLYLFWGKAMDTTDIEDAEVILLAGQAQARAEKTGYVAPPKVVWQVSSETSIGDRLSSGSTGAAAGNLKENQKLVSPNKQYEAVMQPDGNFVLYTADKRPLWATGTSGKGSRPYRLAVQADGNLVVYADSTATWAIGNRSGTAPFTLIMQDDGNLVLYDSGKRAVWASNTQH